MDVKKVLRVTYTSVQNCKIVFFLLTFLIQVPLNDSLWQNKQKSLYLKQLLALVTNNIVYGKSKEFNWINFFVTIPQLDFKTVTYLTNLSYDAY